MHFREDKSINRFSKSLLISQFRFNAYSNLSSRRDTYARTDSYTSKLIRIDESNRLEETEMQKTLSNDPRFESACFEYKNELSGLKIIHKINMLVSLEEQDIINWQTAFKELARICRWPDEVQLEVLRQITDLTLQHRIGEANTPDEFLYKITKLKYNNSTAYKYQTRIINIKQRDYFTIRAYLYDIEKITRRLAFCLDWNDLIATNKIHELLFCGLDDSVKLEIMKYPSRDFDTILARLIEIENFIIQNIKKYLSEINTININLRYNKSKNQNQNPRYCPQNISKHHGINTSKNKFCRFHKSNTHDSSECRALKRKSNHTKTDDFTPKKSYTLNEPKTSPKTIEIPVKIEDKTINGLIDTGSVENYISEGATTLMNLKPTELPQKKLTEVGNGDLVEINKETELKFQLIKDIDNYYCSKFYILPNPNLQIILGMRFLLENDAIINLREGFIVLDGCEYEINGIENKTNLIEKEIMQKTKTFTLSKLDDKINELLRDIKNRNPVLGEIPNIKHKIELIGEMKMIKREYPVPIGLHEDVLNHLKALTENDVIIEKDT
ncbi:hypothetical protein DMUE_4964, partial [Dictyocoela muelleri]